MSSSISAVNFNEGTVDVTVSGGDASTRPIESVPDTVSGGDIQSVVYDDSAVISELVGVNDKLMFICSFLLIVLVWVVCKLAYRFFNMFF